MPSIQTGGFGAKVDWGTSEIAPETEGDLPIFGTDGIADLLNIGSEGQILSISSGLPAWTNGSGLVAPVGSVLAWLKSFTNTPSLPAGWVECNGQTLSDSGSVYNGQTIPDLNGSSATKRLLRGDTSSGSTGIIDVSGTTGTTAASDGSGGSGPHTHSFSANASEGDWYSVVWIMRVK